jgi:hypothetical protein
MKLLTQDRDTLITVTRTSTNLFVLTIGLYKHPFAMWSRCSDVTFFNTNDITKQLAKAFDIGWTIVTNPESCLGEFTTSKHDNAPVLRKP